LEVGDDGVGLPQNGIEDRPLTLGMELIHSLASQFEGVMTQTNQNGLHYRIQFPKEKTNDK